MIPAIKNRISTFDPVYFARCLILTELLVMMFSTAATNFIEALIFLSFLLSAQLRSRVVSAVKLPMVVMALILYGIISLGLLYGIGPWSEKIWMWAAWRKLLLIPLTAAVYDESIWKYRMAEAVVGVCTAAALVSTVGYFLGQGIFKAPPAIVVQNHAMQGMFFAVAAFSAALLIKPSSRFGKRAVWILCACAALLIINLIFIMPGRSGYLAFLVLSLIAALQWVKNRWAENRAGYLLVLFVLPVVLGGLILASPIARDRVFAAVEEIRTHEQAKELTSLGIRVVMWKNTLTIIHDHQHPLIGYGTGSFEEAYRRLVYKVLTPGWQGEPVGDPHNQFMRIIVEHGVLGLLVFLVFIASFFKNTATGTVRTMGIGVLLAWCATSLFSGHFSTFTEGRFLMIWCTAMLTPAPKPK